MPRGRRSRPSVRWIALFAVIAAPAHAEMIAGWDFSQYFGSGFLTIDGATFTDTLDANYSDLDPTFNAGAESAAFGTMYIDGSFGSTDVAEGSGTEEIIPFTGSLAGNADAPAVNPFESFSILTNEGQMFTSQLSLRGDATSSVVFEADVSSVAGTRSNWRVTFAGRNLSGQSDVGIQFSTDGSSYTSYGSVTLLTSEAAFDVALGTATSAMGYVKFDFAPPNGTDLPIIDNVAIEVPEPNAAAMGWLALGTLACMRGRRNAAAE